MGSIKGVVTLGFFGGPLATLGFGTGEEVVEHGFLCVGNITLQPALTARISNQAALTGSITNQPALTASIEVNPCQ